MIREDGSKYEQPYQPNRETVFTRLQSLLAANNNDDLIRLRLGNAYASEGDYVQAYPV